MRLPPVSLLHDAIHFQANNVSAPRWRNKRSNDNGFATNISSGKNYILN